MIAAWGIGLILLAGTATPAAGQATPVPFPPYLEGQPFWQFWEPASPSSLYGISAEPYLQQSTPWGVLYFTTAGQAAAGQVAQAVTAARPYLDAQFGTSLGSSPLVIFVVPQWDHPATGVTPDPTHILVKATSPNIGHTAIHELVHVYQYRTSGVAHTQFRDYGFDNKWLVEGFTEGVAYMAGVQIPAVKAQAENAFGVRLGDLLKYPFTGMYSQEMRTAAFWIFFMQRTGSSARGITEVIASCIGYPANRAAQRLHFDQHWLAFAKGLRNQTPYTPHPWMSVVGAAQPLPLHGVLSKGLFLKHKIHLPPLSFQYIHVLLEPDTGELGIFLQALQGLAGVEVHAVIRTPGGDLQQAWTGTGFKVLTRTGRGLGTSLTVTDFSRLELLVINTHTSNGYFVIPPNPAVQVRTYPQSEQVTIDKMTSEHESGEDLVASDYRRSVVAFVGFPGGVRADRSTISNQWFAQHKGILQLEFKNQTRTRNFSGVFWYWLDRRVWEASGVDKEVQAVFDQNAYFRGSVDFTSRWEAAKATFRPLEPFISNNIYRDTEYGARNEFVPPVPRTKYATPPRGTLEITVPFRFDSSAALPPTANSLYLRPDSRTAFLSMLGGMGAGAMSARNIATVHAEEAKPGTFPAKLAGLFRSMISLGMDEGKERVLTINIFHHKGRALWEVPIAENVKIYYRAMPAYPP